MEPAKVEPAKAEPAKAEPAKAEPAKVEPGKVEFARHLKRLESLHLASHIWSSVFQTNLIRQFLLWQVPESFLAFLGNFWPSKR